MSTSPLKQFKHVTEVRNVAVDMRGKLDVDELLSGVPTVVDIAGVLTISQVAVNTTALTISGKTVDIGMAVQFRVAGGVAGTDYDVRITSPTTATQTVIEKLKIAVIAD